MDMNYLKSSIARFTCFSSIHYDIDSWTIGHPKMLKEYFFRDTLQLSQDGNWVDRITLVVHNLI
jgi:hypothetical protein